MPLNMLQCSTGREKKILISSKQRQVIAVQMLKALNYLSLKLISFPYLGEAITDL